MNVMICWWTIWRTWVFCQSCYSTPKSPFISPYEQDPLLDDKVVVSKILFMFTSIWGNDAIWLLYCVRYFSNWLNIPTRWSKKSCINLHFVSRKNMISCQLRKEWFDRSIPWRRPVDVETWSRFLKASQISKKNGSSSSHQLRRKFKEGIITILLSQLVVGPMNFVHYLCHL